MTARLAIAACLPALLLAAGLGAAHAAALDVLWYSYADDASEYKATIGTIASRAGSYALGSGNDWSLTFFGPDDAAPHFELFDVLVIHGGEAWRTNPPGGSYATPDYRGILDNRAAIEAARGTRTFVSGSDADFHAVRGDTGLSGEPEPATDAAWDGALGYLVNAVDWAAGGSGLGVVSFYHGEFPGSFWWLDEASFLRDELSGHLGPAPVRRDNSPWLPPELAALPVNRGLTSLGLSNWTWSFHGAFALDTPGYQATVLDDAEDPQWALSLIRDSAAAATGRQVPVPGAAIVLGASVLLVAGLRGGAPRRR